jgi:predicted amidohydrolase
VRLALVQMCSEKADIRGNLARIATEIHSASERGIDLIAFPEMSISGYIDPSRWTDAVLDRDDSALVEFGALTAGTAVAAIAGFVEWNPDGKPFITQVVAGDGQLTGFYRKRHVVDEELDWFTPGPRCSPVFNHAGIRFGLSICADIDAPLVFRDAAAAGARLVVECAAPGLYGEQATRNWQAGYDWWRGECRTKLGYYAHEHQMFIAAATAAGRTIDEDFPGGGYLFGPDGLCLAETRDWSDGVLEVEIPDDA